MRVRRVILPGHSACGMVHLGLGSGNCDPKILAISDLLLAIADTTGRIHRLHVVSPHHSLHAKTRMPSGTLPPEPAIASRKSRLLLLLPPPSSILPLTGVYALYLLQFSTAAGMSTPMWNLTVACPRTKSFAKTPMRCGILHRELVRAEG